MTDEETVKAAWVNIGEYDYGGSTKYVYLADAPREFSGTGKAKAWAAAADFTRDRQEQIRQVREEINLLLSMVILLTTEPGDLTAPIYERTIARLESILTDMRKGMK